MKTSILDFNGCTEDDDFYDRIIEALGLEVGYCGRNFSAIYDFGSTCPDVQKLEIKGSSKLTGFLKEVRFERLIRTLGRIKEFHEDWNEEFDYEIID